MLKIVFTFFILITAACQTTKSRQLNLSAADILIQPNENLAIPSTLTSDQVQQDITYLLYVLNSGYGGRKYISPDAMKSALIKIEKIHGSITPTQFRDQIDDALLTIPDNHLKARLGGKHSTQRIEAFKPIDIGKNASHADKSAWDVRIDSFKSKRILYISITAFPSSEDTIWNGFIEKVKELLIQSDFAIIDLRGNGGGDDTFGYKLAEVFFGGMFDHPIRTQYISQTPETIALAVNSLRFQQLQLRIKNEPVPDYYAKLEKEQMNRFHLALNGQLATEMITVEPVGNFKFNPKTGYNKPAYILIDRGCASSCESTTDAFETNPMVKRVGINSLGMIHFGDIGALILPNSKIHVQVPTKHNEYFDKRFIEKTGIHPDIEVPIGEDAYNFIKFKIVN